MTGKGGNPVLCEIIEGRGRSFWEQSPPHVAGRYIPDLKTGEHRADGPNEVLIDRLGELPRVSEVLHELLVGGRVSALGHARRSPSRWCSRVSIAMSNPTL